MTEPLDSATRNYQAQANWWMASPSARSGNAPDVGGLTGMNWDFTNGVAADGGTIFGTQVYVSPGIPPVTVNIARSDAQWMHRDDAAAWAQFQKLALQAGYGDDVATVTSLYNNAIDWAARADNFAKKLTVLDYFLGLPPSGSAGVGTSTQTQVSKRTYSDSEAAGVLNNAFRDMLGREATSKEIAAYMKAVNQMFAKEPSTTTTTSSTTREGGDSRTVSSSTTKGGFDPTQFTIDYTRSRPEFAETFAATQFMGVLNNMINGASSLGNPMGQ